MDETPRDPHDHYLALLTVVHAPGVRAHAPRCCSHYVVGILLGMIPTTPGGLGFVEAGLAGTLVLAGVPAQQATLATLAYLLVSCWLAVAAGPIACALYTRRASRWATRAAGRSSA